MIPEVVYLEIINQVREEISKVADANNNRITALRALLNSYFGEISSLDDIDKEVKDYEKFIKRIFKNANVTKLPIPNVTHSQVIERDLSRRKPFNKSGKGYRDALIWESILVLLQNNQGKDVHFISSNSGDFADEKDQLHKDLLDDLSKLSTPAPNIILHKNSASFIKSVLLSKLPTPDQTFITYLQKNEPDFDFETELAEILNDELSGRDVDNRVANKPEEFESITISMVEEISDWELETESKYSDHEVVLEISCTAYCEFDAFLYKGDLYLVEDEDISINEFDWNKHYSWVSFSDNIRLSLLLELDLEDNKIVSVETLEIDSTSKY